MPTEQISHMFMVIGWEYHYMAEGDGVVNPTDIF